MDFARILSGFEDFGSDTFKLPGFVAHLASARLPQWPPKKSKKKTSTQRNASKR
jgi:hypothetical protein